MKTVGALLLTSISLLCSCVAPVGSELHVPEDATQTCQDQCHSIGLALSAVAIMANNVGCVCVASASAGVGVNEAVTGGMATIMLQEQQRQQQQQQQRQRNYQSQPY